ncbi:MAG TPA: hypothetical protein VFV50_14655, partial [Bdellovibrionales bacterium]|nr:hypothetical protein [Bdellovibrionales bacterium]
PSEILIQSHFHERHLESFERAVRDEMVYPCFCSRKEVVEGLASAPHGPMTVYTGRCRGLRADEWPAYDRPTLAWRFKLNPSDPTQDFVVARTAAPGALASWSPREGFAPAYQWACAVDDYDGRYTLLVRAFDLLDSAAQQRGIQSWLASNANAPVRHPAVFHTALIVNDDSSRLEKRTKGVTLAELIARGLTEKTIIEKFESTFHIDRYQFAPGAIFGEDRRQMTLSELGF